MSDDPVGGPRAGRVPEPVEGLDSVTDEVLPALIARLRASRLGELEVRADGWRVRLRRDAAAIGRTVTGSTSGGSAEAAPGQGSVARSPGVGYFSPAGDLVVGHSVQAGDYLGSIDVLGIVQDVTAPTDGLVSRVLAEAGQAVEYGQALADIDPLEIVVDDTADEAGTDSPGAV